MAMLAASSTQPPTESTSTSTYRIQQDFPGRMQSAPRSNPATTGEVCGQVRCGREHLQGSSKMGFDGFPLVACPGNAPHHLHKNPASHSQEVPWPVKNARSNTAVSSPDSSLPPRPRKAGLATGENSAPKTIQPWLGASWVGVPTSAWGVGAWDFVNPEHASKSTAHTRASPSLNQNAPPIRSAHARPSPHLDAHQHLGRAQPHARRARRLGDYIRQDIDFAKIEDPLPSARTPNSKPCRIYALSSADSRTMLMVHALTSTRNCLIRNCVARECFRDISEYCLGTHSLSGAANLNAIR